MNPQETYLAKFTSWLQADDNITQAFIVGSYAKGGFHRYSDLDIRLVINKQYIQQYRDDRYTLINKFDDLLFSQPVEPLFGDSLAISYFKDDYKIDCFFLIEEDVRPSHWFKNMLILKDTDDFLIRELTREK